MERHNSEYYRNLTEEKLAADEYFQQWVLLQDVKSKSFWTSFQETYPDQVNKIKNALKLVKQLGDKNFRANTLSGHEKKFLKSIIYRELGFPDPIESIVKKNRENKWRWRALAAALLMVFFVAALYWPHDHVKKQVSIIKHETQSRQIKEIILPDSSVVILNGGSSIQYSSTFSDSSIREVLLTGNAYFNVKKKTAHTPFVVHANEMDIMVTGTEFNVNAHAKATDIVLTSGNVNVSLKNNKQKTAHIHAGEAVKLDTVSGDFVMTKVDTELYTSAWKSKEWHFRETSLEVIAQFIKEYYGVDVVFKNNMSRKLMITAVVSVNDFQTLVSILERTLNINIRLENQQLIIH